MFKRAILGKFEWNGLPDDITELFVEKLLLNSSNNNFAVVKTPYGELWGYFNVLQREEKYGIPNKIDMCLYNGGTIQTENFVLFNNFNMNVELNLNYIIKYEYLIKLINKALLQHIQASELIATFTANNQEEKNELEKAFSKFAGIKILKSPKATNPFESEANITQFEITPRTQELEQLKKDLERDLFLRLGVDAGIEKTHMTDLNLKNSEQPLALINSYELKLREDFCKRYNLWNKANGFNTNLSVKIHEINNQNTINRIDEEQEETTEDGNL